MKPSRLWSLIAISMLLTVFLSSCRMPDPAYVPTGEIYVKTSVSRGDGGVNEVVDMEMEKAEYAAEGDITVPVKIGVGHHPRNQEDGEEYACLVIQIWLDVAPKDEPTETIEFEYPDWETEKFNSTEPEEKPKFWIIPYYYGEFYPLYHETVELTIPADVSFGFISAELYMVGVFGNDYRSDQVRIDFERVDGVLRFHAL